MKISTPEIKVIRFSSEDVIVASSSLTGVNGSFYYIPSDQSSGDSVEFYGTIGSYNNSAVGYVIEKVRDTGPVDSEQRQGLMSGGSFTFSDGGFPVPASVMESMARQYYDAFSYNGQYYTTGISYYNQYWKH